MVNQMMLDFGRRSSSIRDLFEYGNAQKKIVGEENVFDFSLGNPSVPAPQAVSDAFIDVIKNEPPIMAHGYTPSAGDVEVRNILAGRIGRINGKKYDKRNIYLTCGAAGALAACLKGFILDGDTEIVGIAPYFPEYERFTVGLGGRFMVVPPQTSDFQIDIKALEGTITSRTQAVIVNSPNNPSGAVYTRKTLEALADALRRKSAQYGHAIYLMSDEPYRELVYDGLETPFIPDIYDNTIICYSFSKSLSLPGDRIGYMFVPDTMENFDEVCWATAGAARSMGYVCAPALMQRMIARCADVKTDIETYDRNRRLIYGELTRIGYECCHPDGAFYLFLKAPHGHGSKEFSEMAKKENVLLVPGDDFGCPGYLRLSYCIDYNKIKRSIPLFKKLFDLG